MEAFILRPAGRGSKGVMGEMEHEVKAGRVGFGVGVRVG